MKKFRRITMICENCKNHITDEYITIGDVDICPDCYENLTVEELAELLGLEISKSNLQEDPTDEINDFKFRQERGK
jgi:Fe-S oxidoreductase